MARPKAEELKAHGLSDLHAAIIHGQLGRVREIISDKTHLEETIETPDLDGTTPLMTAVLAGRLEITRFLIQNGASVLVRDLRGRDALAHTKTGPFWEKLRTYKRLGLPSMTRSQHTERQVIAKILQHSMALESCRRTGQHQDAGAVFLKEGKSLIIHRPYLEFKVARPNLEVATTGFIASVFRPDVKTAATSGWLPNEGRGPHVLDNVKYLKLVGELARVLGFELEASFRDTNGKSLPEHYGRFTASHSEKKLATFWVIAALRANLQTTDLSRVAGLGDIRLPQGWREATIFLDHSPCHNCWEFLDIIKRTTGISIFVEACELLTRGDRKALVGCPKCECESCKRKFFVEKTDVTSTERVSDDVGDEAKKRRSGPAEIQPKTVPAPSRAPEAWREYTDDQGNVCAKPRSRRIDANEFSSHLEASLPAPQLPSGTSDRASVDSGEETHAAHSSPEGNETALFQEPISTIGGRSGYFKTPSRQASMEAGPDLARFLYKGRNPSTHASQARPYQADGPSPPRFTKKPVSEKRAGAKSAVGKKKGRAARTRKDENIHARSGFARAVEHFRRKRGESERGV